MQVLLPDDGARRLTQALVSSREREIGGILMGEHIAPGIFRIKDFSIQRDGGTGVTFVRTMRAVLIPLRRFFRQTRHHYTRFNYLGEWHSHPGLALSPSPRDCSSMWEIVEDSAVGPNFAVLLLVHLDDEGAVRGRVYVFHPGRAMFEGEFLKEIA